MFQNQVLGSTGLPSPPTMPADQCIFETVAETRYIDGDILKPEGAGNKIIVQVCNDAGAWCKASQKALSRVWSKPEECYKQWFKSKADFKLGKVKLVAVEEDIWVALMIAQKSEYFGKSPIYQYGFVKNGILEVSRLARQMEASVHLL